MVSKDLKKTRSSQLAGKHEPYQTFCGAKW